jgi:hypothetical protein
MTRANTRGGTWNLDARWGDDVKRIDKNLANRARKQRLPLVGADALLL